MHNLSLSLPSELWEFILDYLDRKSLLQCQHTCHAWRTIVLAYVMSGRLKNRAFRCQRLSQASKDYLEHRPRTWDTVCLTPNFHLLITAIGVFVPSSGGSEVIIKVDARPLEDPLRPIDVGNTVLHKKTYSRSHSQNT